jgi:hypothetical protein
VRELLEAIECEGAFCTWCGAYISPRHFNDYDAGDVDPRVQFCGTYLVARDRPAWRGTADEITRLCRGQGDFWTYQPSGRRARRFTTARRSD